MLVIPRRLVILCALICVGVYAVFPSLAAAGTLKLTGEGLTYRADDAVSHEVEALASADGRSISFIDYSVTAFD
ncbi:MAG: hypothetical protein JWN41_104, partial [Thermoleophilia bacterium]|nr:hypothetical protein [Thermoleophilia bacterium]